MNTPKLGLAYADVARKKELINAFFNDELIYLNVKKKYIEIDKNNVPNK